MATAQSMLLPALLAMDVYHRYVDGGLRPTLDPKRTEDPKKASLPLPDGVTSFGDVGDKPGIGFVAKAYEYKGTIYIAYRGTDDGSLDLWANSAVADHNKAGAERDLITCAAA